QALLTRRRKPPLVLEQPLLRRKATPITSQVATRADDTVTRHDDRDRISSVRGAHGPARRRPPDRFRDISVAPQLAIRNRHQRVPHALLERSAFRSELDVELAPLTREVFAQLP